MKKFGAWFILLLITLVVLFGFAAVFSQLAQGSVSQYRPNSLGVSETYQNPVTYLFGLPVAGQILDDRFTNIRFKPYAAAEMFDESILFCGDVTDQFKGKNGPVVLTYRTKAAGMYRGVGCHELISVFKVLGE